MARKAKKRKGAKKMAAADIETTDSPLSVSRSVTTTDVVADPPPFTIDPPPFTISVPSSPAPPTPADIEATKQFLLMQREQLTAAVVQIEVLLGFIASADDLSVRIARVERFLGI